MFYFVHLIIILYFLYFFYREEDQKLLELAKTMKRNWQKISEQFTSFKNRKGCLTRYKILQKNLAGGKNVDLKEVSFQY
jgi:predicted PurR-regulated permease PerM